MPTIDRSIMMPLQNYLIFSALLFAVGLAGALTRRNAILVLVGIELMLNAANLNFIAFWRYSPDPDALQGMMFVLFSIAVAAARGRRGPGPHHFHLPALQNNQRGRGELL